MEEWREYKLGNVLTIKYGKDHKQIADGDIPIYGSGGIMRYGDRSLYDGPSILIPRKGSLNNIMFANNPFWTVDTMFWTIINKDVANPLFVYYSICKKDFASLNVGSAVPSLTVPVIEDIDILLPSKETQDRVVAILKSLDDKIEVNRRINENLEQQAQALFKSWFVDFEPFKNGEFVESELGMIPKGWRVEALTSFGRIVCGKTPSKAESSYYGGSIPFIKIPDMHNKVFVEQSEDNLSETGDNSQPAKRIPPYSILVSCIATVGLVCINTIESHTNQQINTIIPDSPTFRYYLYQKIFSLKDYLINLGRGGTATLNVNTKIFGNIKIIKPTDELLLEYDKMVSPLFNKIETIQKESRHLAQLRDTLLPRLMSGELKVNEIENVL